MALSDTFVADIRYALRMLAKNPGFAAITIAALALGVGINSAIFSVVNGILLRPLPYPEADRIVTVWRASDEDREGAHSGPDFLDLQAENRVFAHLAAYREDVFDLTTTGADPQRLNGMQVSAGFFDVFGAPPLAGRVFHDGQDLPDSERLAVLAEGVWATGFGRDPAVIGRVVQLNGEAVTIVGVMPTRFASPREIQIWVLAQKRIPSSPIDAREGDAREDRRIGYLSVVGRLRPGVSVEQARDDVTRVAADLARRYPDNNRRSRIELARLHEHMVRDFRRALLVILTAVGFVLLIACANVASVMLARASARQREIAVRASLGAGRGRLIRQLLTESVLIALAGGAVGLLVASWGTDILLSVAPGDIPRLDEVTLDGRVVTFTLITSLLTGLLFGLAPAFQMSQVDVFTALRESSDRTVGSSGRRHAANALVIGEVALALVLLAGAGLMLNSFVRLQRVDPGFRVSNVVVVELPLPQARYPKSADQTRLYQGVLERLVQMTPTRDSALGWPAPMWGSSGSAGLRVEGRQAPGGQAPTVAIGTVSPGYFAVMNVPVVAGRDISMQDTEGAPRVAVISQSLARRYFADVNPIGRRISFGDDDSDWVSIVGIVGDVRLSMLRDAPQPTAYFSFQQFSLPFLYVVTRTASDQTAVVGAIRTTVAELDRDLPIGEARPMSDIVSRSAAEPRFRALLLCVFASLALVLAAVGVYGIISQTVARRVPEIGIRMALGAGRWQMMRLILRQGVLLTLAGLGIGLVIAFGVSRLLSSLLFDVGAADPATFVVVSALLFVVALTASYLPARRAMKVDPIVALRAE